MKKIFRYPLQIIDEQVIKIPCGGKILSVKEKDNELSLWVLVETDNLNLPINTKITIVGTGWPADHIDDHIFIDTVITHMGQMVWHVFERKVLKND